MIKRFFSFPVFLAALILGLVFVYLYEPDKKIIYVYPTPDNIDDIEYKDVAENCFKFKYNKLQCPSDKEKIKTIPIQ